MVRPPPKLSTSQASKSQAVAQAFAGRRLQRLGPAVQASAAPSLAFETQGPSSFVPLAQLGSASGLKGQLRVFPLQQSMVVDAQSGELVSSAGPLFLASAQQCWLKTPESRWLRCQGLQFSPGLEALLAHGTSGRLRVTLSSCQHRSQAEALQHSALGLETQELQALSKPFWRVFDWIDWQAVSKTGKPLGRVTEVLVSKFQAVLRLEAFGQEPQTFAPERALSELIPVVPRYVLQVSPAERRIVLDWAW